MVSLDYEIYAAFDTNFYILHLLILRLLWGNGYFSHLCCLEGEITFLSTAEAMVIS